MKRSVAWRRVVVGSAIGLLAVAGCKMPVQPEPIVAVPPQSFVRGWSASVGNHEPLESLHLVSDQLYVYSKDNQAYVFSAPSGKVIYSDQIVPPGAALYPPVALPDNKIIYPASDSLIEFDKPGRRLTTIRLGKTTTGPAISQAYTLYLGLSGETGGRLAALDLTPSSPTQEQVATAKKLGIALQPQFAQIVTKWEVFTGAAITSTPAVYQGVVYAGASDGKVWAVNESGSGIWELPDGSHTFQAAGPINADLKVDDVGVYAASLDAKLYCIDRGSGRTKWAFYAAAGLTEAPVLGANTIYQIVPKYGLVAIDKRSAGIAKPKWLNAEAIKYLSEDDKYVYALKNSGVLMALDKTNGLEQFEGKKHELTLFAVDPKSPIIYGATAQGLLYSVKPVLLPGVVGQMAMMSLPTVYEEIALAGVSR